MEEEEIPKIITTLQLGGRRGRERPRLRWMDGLNRDAVSIGNEELKNNCIGLRQVEECYCGGPDSQMGCCSINDDNDK